MDINVFAIGAIVNAALYLLSVIVVGLWTGNTYAAIAAVIAFGITYLSHIIGIEACRRSNYRWSITQGYVVAFSIVAGAAAGLFLLF